MGNGNSAGCPHCPPHPLAGPKVCRGPHLSLGGHTLTCLGLLFPSPPLGFFHHCPSGLPGLPWAVTSSAKGQAWGHNSSSSCPRALGCPAAHAPLPLLVLRIIWLKATAVEVTGMGVWDQKQTSQSQGSPSLQAGPGPGIPGHLSLLFRSSSWKAKQQAASHRPPTLHGNPSQEGKAAQRGPGRSLKPTLLWPTNHSIRLLP